MDPSPTNKKIGTNKGKIEWWQEVERERRTVLQWQSLLKTHMGISSKKNIKPHFMILVSINYNPFRAQNDKSCQCVLCYRCIPIAFHFQEYHQKSEVNWGECEQVNVWSRILILCPSVLCLWTASNYTKTCMWLLPSSCLQYCSMSYCNKINSHLDTSLTLTPQYTAFYYSSTFSSRGSTCR